MDDRQPTPAKRSRRLILAAMFGFAIAVVAVAYAYSNDLIDLVQSVARGKPSAAQVHIRY
jgi:hypothetical protein